MTSDPAQARAAAERIGYPVVVKPRALGASIGVVMARDAAEFDAASPSRRRPARSIRASTAPKVIVEGYAGGPEVSVDGAVHKGEYLPMFLARKESGEHPYFEEVGHVVDAADPLLADEELVGTLALAHRALGIEDGITHSEMRLTPRGPVVIEINGRVGGDLIPLLGQLATGIDSGEVLFDVATGQRPDITPTRRFRGRHPVRTAGGRLRGAVGDRAVRFARPRHGVADVEPGTTLRLPPGGYLARHSFVVCEPPT